MKKILMIAVLAMVAMGEGCATGTHPAASTAPVPGATSTEATGKKIADADAQRRITAVNNDKSIPEAAKPGIIASIKHSAGLQ